MTYGIAAVLAGGSILGSGIGAFGANQAAQTQARAANRAIQAQQNQFNQIQGNLLPFIQGGAGSAALLQALYGVSTPANNFGQGYGGLTGNFLQSPTATLGAPPAYNMPTFGLGQFQQSPGYQYELGQAQQAIQNSGTGKTGAIGGNTLNALQENAVGLASQDWWNAYNAYVQNYQNQFNAQDQNYWNQFNAINNQRGQIANVLSSLTGQGIGAATSSGAAGTTAGQGIANSLIGQGNAQAAGIGGIANNAIGGVNNLLLSGLMPQGNQGSFLNYLFSGGGGNFNPQNNFLIPGSDQPLNMFS